MGDDARTRALAALDAAYSLAPIANPNVVQVNGGRVLVTYEQAVDALADAGLLAEPSHLDRLAAYVRARLEATTPDDVKHAITFALCEAFGWEYLCDLRVDTSERPSVVAPLSADDAERFFRYRYDYVARSPENAPSGTWTDAQVDGLARHLYLVENGGPKPWAELAEETQDVWRSRARRALAAVEEARDA